MKITEANSDLLGKTYAIPLKVQQFLQSMMNSVGEGKQRIQNLLSNPNPTYEQIKRFKHDIEHSYQGDWSMALNWINGVLASDRQSIYNKKKTTMDTGMQNRFIKPHEKDNVIGFGGLRENNKVMKIKITEEQQQLIKEEILNEGENYSRYKSSALREILAEKQEQLINLKQEIKNITQILNSKAKVKQSSPVNDELSNDIDLVAPELQ